MLKMENRIIVPDTSFYVKLLENEVIERKKANGEEIKNRNEENTNETIELLQFSVKNEIRLIAPVSTAKENEGLGLVDELNGVAKKNTINFSQDDVQEYLENHQNHFLYTSVVNNVREIVYLLTLLPIDDSLREEAGKLREIGGKGGHPPQFSDCIFHALAIRLGGVFVTADARHFNKMEKPNVKVGHCTLIKDWKKYPLLMDILQEEKKSI